MSIFHRITGVALAGAAIFVVWWFLAAATGTKSFGAIDWFLTSFVGELMLFGALLSLMYHLCNGIRHLLWDIGWGFDLKIVENSGYIAIAAAVVLSILVLIIGIAS